MRTERAAPALPRQSIPHQDEPKGAGFGRLRPNAQTKLHRTVPYLATPRPREPARTCVAEQASPRLRCPRPCLSTADQTNEGRLRAPREVRL